MRERKRVKIPRGLPKEKLGIFEEKVREKIGRDFHLESIDQDTGEASFVRGVDVATVSSDGKILQASLPDTFATPSAGDRAAASFADQYPGYHMIRFDPYNKRALLAKLPRECVITRDAIAEALGVKPWDVEVAKRRGGGYQLLRLPTRYTPSKHDAKLAEAAVTKVPGGKPGWFVRIDGQSLTGEIIPAELPSFPPLITPDMDHLGANKDVTPFGMKLPQPGSDQGEIAQVDWNASNAMLLAGLPGSGKSVTLNALLASQIAAGCECVVVDDPAKSVDFLWAKPYLRNGGWGCDSDRHAVTALALAYEEGQRRAKILADRGVVNWLDLPEDERFTPIFIIVDEYTAITMTEKEPTSLPKDHPLRVEIAEANLQRVAIGRYVSKIIAEERFVGVRIVLSTQVTNAATGVAPSLRSKIGHKVLQGSNPSQSARQQIFSDEKSVPNVPENVQASGRAAKGVGAADLEGVAPYVYKSQFASTADYLERLKAMGVKVNPNVEPSLRDVSRLAPTLAGDDVIDDGPIESRLSSEGGFGDAGGHVDELKGAAKANHDRAVQMARAKVDRVKFAHNQEQKARGAEDAPLRSLDEAARMLADMD